VPQSTGAEFELSGLAQVFRSLNFPDAVLVVDSNARIVLANEAAVSMFGAGAGADRLAGRSLQSLFREESALRRFQRCLNTPDIAGGGGTGARPVPTEALRADGSALSVDVTMAACAVDAGAALVVLSAREAPTLGSLEEAEEIWRYFDVAVGLGDRLASDGEGQESLAWILPAMFSHLDWDVACLWMVTADARYLVCAATWPDDSGPTWPFEDASRRVRLGVGDGLPGSAWGSGRPLISSVAGGEMRLLRQEAIQACGLSTGLAFPLIGPTGVVGVTEMYSTRSLPISLRLVDGLGSLGRQIGHLLDRIQVENRLKDQERLHSFLLEAATVLSGSTNYAEALGRLAAISAPTMADLCLIDVKEPDASISRMAAVHADPRKSRLVTELQRRYPPAAGSGHPSNDVMRTGRSMWSPVMTDDYLRRTTRDERHFQIVKELEFESYMCVPLQDGDEILGSITLVSAGSGRKFGPADLALPEELARRATSVVKAARHYEAEHQLAHGLQRLLLPDRLPDIEDFEVCVRYAAGTPEADAGGDFYDVVTLPSGRIGLVIGDVEGHDALAAATMGQLRSATRALAGQVREPAELVDALRWSWALLGFERIATALLARLDPATGEVVLASAGHLPPLHIEAGGEARLVPIDSSPPLGVRAPTAVEHKMLLGPGDVLFFYTDGLVEEPDSLIVDRLHWLVAMIQEAAHRPLDDLCDHVLRAYARTRRRQPDDVAFMAVKRLPSQ